MTLALVAVGGALGAVARHLVARLGIGAASTLIVNSVGSLLLGFLIAIDPPDWLLALAGSGVCGALTTMSSLALEISDRPRRRGLVLGISHVVLGLAAAALGVVVATRLVGTT